MLELTAGFDTVDHYIFINILSLCSIGNFIEGFFRGGGGIWPLNIGVSWSSVLTFFYITSHGNLIFSHGFNFHTNFSSAPDLPTSLFFWISPSSNLAFPVLCFVNLHYQAPRWSHHKYIDSLNLYVCTMPQPSLTWLASMFAYWLVSLHPLFYLHT